jgi:hypothetical protein
MMNMRILLIGCFVMSLMTLNAQDFGFGVKAGMSFSTVNGDLVDGEDRSYKSGFHVGPTFSLKYTESFGLRAELLYNQMGTDYSYSGPSYFVLRSQEEKEVIAGNKELDVSTFLNYLDIPVQVYYKFGQVVEVYGGVNFLILGGGSAGGKVEFRNEDLMPNPISARLDYSYNSDKAKGGEGSGVTPHMWKRNTYEVPETLGAYYDFDKKDGRAWNTIDYGLHAGVRIFFNQALYFEGRAYFGFNDVSNNDLDLKQDVAPGQLMPLPLSQDDDRNLSIQASVGFSF